MKNNSFLNHCTRFSSVILVFFGLMAIKAQVGINTDKPESMLDVKGNIKIGNENKAENTGKTGMLRWSDTKKCFEGHNGEEWSCLDNFRRPREIKLLVQLDGNDEGMLSYNKLSDWPNKGFVTFKGFKITDGIGENLYDANTGIITIPRDGLYEIKYILRLRKKDTDTKTGLFNGEGGDFDTSIRKNGVTLNNSSIRVFRGSSIENSRPLC